MNSKSSCGNSCLFESGRKSNSTKITVTAPFLLCGVKVSLNLVWKWYGLSELFFIRGDVFMSADLSVSFSTTSPKLQDPENLLFFLKIP